MTNASKIFIDDMQAKCEGTNTLYCQMWSLDPDALHEFAKRLGIPESLYRSHILDFQYYDVPLLERKLAVLRGATPVTIKEMYAKVHWERRNGV